MASTLFSTRTFQRFKTSHHQTHLHLLLQPPPNHQEAIQQPHREGGMNTSLVITLSTGHSLFHGRFVFFNFQRENMAKQVPEQNGVSHFEAGDVRAKEYASLLKSNYPVGFNIVDVLAWGSIGKIVDLK